MIKKFALFVLGSLISSGAGLGAVVLFPASVTPSGATVIVPQTAIERSPALDYVDIIHYKKDFARPSGPSKGGPSCYGFISKGAKLKAIEDIYVNGVNSGMQDSDVLNGTVTSANTWDSETAANIFNSYVPDSDANFDDGASPDGRNEVSFGSYPQEGVIAVTRIWGIFYGPPSGRYIDQFDILFNTAYSWGDAADNAGLMDFQNIATHELGHGVGLADIYDSGCGTVTMYGYSNYGETQKRTLELPDIKGLETLYGT